MPSVPCLRDGWAICRAGRTLMREAQLAPQGAGRATGFIFLQGSST